jgi:orotate phosphoribosyltransferase
MVMKQDWPFERFLIESGVLAFHDQPVTFKSGIQSRWYINCRVLSQRLPLLEKAAEHVVTFLKQTDLLQGADAVIGVPEGATELANAVSRLLIRGGGLGGDKLYAIRVKPKEHGDPANRFWINGNIPSKVIVLEDVTTTGGSAIAFVEKLREAGTQVIAVVGLVNRLHRVNGKTVTETFAEAAIPYHSLTNAELLLPPFLQTFPEEARPEVESIINAEYVK